MTLLPKTKRIRDRKYLDSYDGTSCFTCGANDGTVVGGHIRSGLAGGMGLKPSDNETIGMCHRCHAKQHEIGEKKFWLEKGYTINKIKEIARQRYETWLTG